MKPLFEYNHLRFSFEDLFNVEVIQRIRNKYMHTKVFLEICYVGPQRLKFFPIIQRYPPKIGA